MSDKPTSVPRWADVGGDIVEPSASKKDVGWAAGEKPPNSYFNWLLYTLYLWCQWLFVGKLGRASLTDHSPVLAFCDQDSRERLYVDPSGYFGGPAIQQHYVPYPISATFVGASANDRICEGLESSNDINTTVRSLGPVGSIPCPWNSLTVADAAVSQSARVYTPSNGSSGQIIGDLDNVVAIMEGRVRLETVGANEVDVFWGLHTDGETVGTDYHNGANHSFVMFEKLSGDTNWQACCADTNAETKTDTSVPPVAGTWQTLRIEYHGVNTPVGVLRTFATARFFIDGTMVAETYDANVPATTTWILGVGVRNRATATGPAADIDFDFMPIRVAWNQMLNWDIPV